MAGGTVRLSQAQALGLAALGKAARKLPARAAAEVRFAQTAVGERDVVVIVLSTAGALIGRTELVRKVPLRALRTILVGAEVAAERLATSPPAAETPPLAASEASLLDRAGLTGAADDTDPLERACIDLELLLRESSSLEEAARELRVSPGRLRQRLSPRVRTLYGIKAGRGWRIPRFQFAKRGRLARSIDRVLPRVSAEAHPLAIQNWFTSPHQDLVVGDNERQVSPIAWMESGRAPDVVAELAAEI
jgi:hypothetical protein